MFGCVTCNMVFSWVILIIKKNSESSSHRTEEKLPAKLLGAIIMTINIVYLIYWLVLWYRHASYDLFYLLS